MLNQANKGNGITKEAFLFNQKTISVKNNLNKDSQVLF